MKKYLITAIIAGLAVLSGCSSIPGLPTDLISAGQSIQATAQVAEAIDFKSGEVLASDGTGNDVTGMTYYVGKVLTPASDATKKQAEVLFVGSGAKAWASFVIPSHKAQKTELTVGRLVFVLSNYRDSEAKDVDLKEYRQSRWDLGRITSLDEMFKNRVEIDGIKYHPGLVRIADIALE